MEITNKKESWDLIDILPDESINIVKHAHQLKNPLVTNKGKPKHKMSFDEDFNKNTDKELKVKESNRRWFSPSPSSRRVIEVVFGPHKKQKAMNVSATGVVGFREIAKVKPLKQSLQVSSTVLLSQLFTRKS